MMPAASPAVMVTSSPFDISISTPPAFARRQRQLLHRDRRGQEALIAGDHVEWAPVAELQGIAARVGGVEQAQTHPAARHLDIRILHAVDQQRIADEAALRRRIILRRAEVIEALGPE